MHGYYNELFINLHQSISQTIPFIFSFVKVSRLHNIKHLFWIYNLSSPFALTVSSRHYSTVIMRLMYIDSAIYEQISTTGTMTLSNTYLAYVISTKTLH